MKSELYIRLAREDCRLELPTGAYSDGQPMMQDEPIKAYFTEAERGDLDALGHTGSGLVAYVAPFNAEPKLPCVIVRDYWRHDVLKIETLRTFGGELVGYKMIVAGGA